jgi:mRNA-degrading endonuclease RelE of RelBE toxin-antitoxin system
MFTVIETPVFVRSARRVWDDVEQEDFVDWISTRPEAGEVIQGSGGLRKVRWSRQGLGRRGGSRVIYFVRNDRGEVVLLLVYAKSAFDDFSPAFLQRLKEAFDGS